MPTEADPLLTPDGRVAGDLLCGGCGYNLRTLPVEGRCPECAAPVREAVERQRWTPVAWLEVFSGGLGALFLAFVCTTLFVVLALIGNGASGVFFTLAVGIGVLGLLSVTKPIPRRPSTSDALCARSLIRRTMLGTSAAVAGIGLIWLVCEALGNPANVRDVLLLAAGLTLALSALAMPVLLARHFRDVLRYLNRAREAQLASGVQIVTALLEAAIAAALATAAYVQSSELAVLGGVIAFPLLAMWGLLLWRVSGAFEAALQKCGRGDEG